jgi:hypothetical protein
MDMLPLRDSFTRESALWKTITLDNRHARKMLRKHPASQQAGHTRADHYSLLAAQFAQLFLNTY